MVINNNITDASTHHKYYHALCKKCGGPIMMPRGAGSYVCQDCHTEIPLGEIVTMNVACHLTNTKTGIAYPMIEQKKRGENENT